MAEHRLDAAEGLVTDVFSRDLEPVLTVDPGDTVTVHSLDAHPSPRSTTRRQTLRSER